MTEYAGGGKPRIDTGHTRFYFEPMRAYTAVVERCPETGLYVGYVPGFAGAHSQGETLDELQRNLREVIEMILEDGEPKIDTEFVGTQSITVAA